MESWSFLTSHARVLLCIAREQGVRLRDIAASLDITERSACGIVTDLTALGYMVKQKDGRRNRYQIQAHLPLPETTSQQPAWVSMSLWRGGSKYSVWDPMVTATLPSCRSSADPTAASSDSTARYSMLWPAGCWKIWRSVFRWWLLGCAGCDGDDIRAPARSVRDGAANIRLEGRAAAPGSTCRQLPVLRNRAA